jgi:hypothetical protein
MEKRMDFVAFAKITLMAAAHYARSLAMIVP